MRRGSMREFWDARAREDPFYFVDNRLRYGDPDLERFWASGDDLLARFEDLLGVEVSPGDEVVEIGCGVGRVTRALAARARHVRAMDVSEQMIARARELNPELANVEWIVGDGTSLAPVADASADVCFSFVVFQHIPEPAVTLGYVGEMGRVLRPSGVAAFQISNLPERHRRPGAARRLGLAARAALGRGPRGQDHPAWLGSAVELPELGRAAEAAGLDLERVVGEGSQHCLVLARRRPSSDDA